jgi:flavorubredoxin
MNETFKAIKVTDKVYWVGAIDWALRDFHGYLTSRGSTYNAYLVLADKITLIDTVKAPFKNEMLSRIATIINPSDISYIISDHSEMDHTGCLSQVIEEIKPDKVYASAIGATTLKEHFHLAYDITAVKDGESISLGNMNVSFYETKMLHWPDSMFSYIPEEKLLFSQDAFGMHLASSERFADEIDEDILEYEGGKYYANIILPYSPLVLNLLQKVKKLGIDIKIIAPDHGPVWRKNLNKILELYAKWASQKPTNKAVVVYDTMWQSTAKMAQAISEGLMSGGTHTKVMPLKSVHRSDVVTEILNAGAFLVGSPTMNNNMFPTIADTLTYLKGLKPQNLIGAAFGSYGWSGEAVSHINETLKAMKVDIIGEGLKVKYVPDERALKECYSLGAQISEKLKEL